MNKLFSKYLLNYFKNQRFSKIYSLDSHIQSLLLIRLKYIIFFNYETLCSFSSVFLFIYKIFFRQPFLKVCLLNTEDI